MKVRGRFIALATMCLAFGCASHLPSSAAPEHLVATHGTVTIETIRQGKGPVIVLLPSLGRGAGDFDDVAAYLERDGFTVLRPQPRGIGASVGPLTDVNMHDFGQYDAVVVPNVFKPMLEDRVTVEVISNAGHAMAPEQPKAMSDAIARFAHQMYRQ